MAYLYAGLGVAMLAGIMALLEFGVSLESLQTKFQAENDLMGSYDKTASGYDAELLRILSLKNSEAMGLGKVLCGNIKDKVDPQKINPTEFEFDSWLEGDAAMEKSERYTREARGPEGGRDQNLRITYELFEEACVVAKKGRSYRAIVAPVGAVYRLYSCVLDSSNSSECSFEEESS